MPRFCASCGKSIEKGSICSDCKVKDFKYKEVKTMICPSKRFFFKGKWNKFSDLNTLTKTLLKNSVEERFEVISGLEKYPELLEKPGLKKNFEVSIVTKDFELVLNIYVETTYSPNLKKVGTDYFEGILQIRNFNDEVKAYVKKLLESDKNKEIYINKKVEKKESADYYFVDKRKIPYVANKIIRNFGGFVDFNAQLFSYNKQTSKDIHRVNALLQIPRFEKKDVILVDKRQIYVTGTSKLITGIDIQKNKKYTFSMNQKYEEDILVYTKYKTQITQIYPLEVLNPEDFQPMPAINFLDLKVKPGMKTTIVIHDQKAYILK